MGVLDSARPINGLVVVRVTLQGGAERRSPSGLIIEPDTVASYPTTGEVVAVSEGKYTPKGFLKKPEVSPGDVVFFSYRDIKWNEHPGRSGGNYDMQHGDLFVIDQDDLMAVVE